MKKQLFLLLLILCFLLSAGEGFAARNLTITSNKSSLANDDELVIVSSTSGFTNGEKIYVKGAFFKDGSSNYFGFTKSNGDWIKNSTNALSQREIIIGAWDNNQIVKPDFSDNGFIGSGNYKFKLGFYYLTSSGNASSINWSNNDLNINIDFTPTEAPAPTSSKSTSDSSTSSISSKSPTPTKQPTITPSKYTNSTASRKSNEEFVKIARIQRTASEYAKIKPVTNIEAKKKGNILGAKDKRTYAPILFISGVVFLLAGLSSFIIKFLRDRSII